MARCRATDYTTDSQLSLETMGKQIASAMIMVIIL